MVDRKKYFYLFFVLGLVGLLLFPSTAEAKKKKIKKKTAPYSVSAESALLFDITGRHKYYAKAIDKKVFPASTTKIVTVMVAMERLRLDDVVTITKAAEQALPSKIDLKEGEQYRVRDLLYAALLNSANDAAVALAIAAAGSQDKFVVMMNKKVQQLGAKNTVFANPHGLPSSEPQHTTAYDMFLILRAALKNDFFKQTIKIRTMTVQSVSGRKIALKSHNKALFKGWKEGVYGKTGYTRAAKACFVGVVDKGNQSLIVAVFGCPGFTRWDDIKFIVKRYGLIDL